MSSQPAAKPPATSSASSATNSNFPAPSASAAASTWPPAAASWPQPAASGQPSLRRPAAEALRQIRSDAPRQRETGRIFISRFLSQLGQKTGNGFFNRHLSPATPLVLLNAHGII